MQSSKVNSPLLSIIIPAHNEERRLPNSLHQITGWMQTIPLDIEIIIVENGSQDRTTDIAESYAHRFDNVRVLHSTKGKGAAVREGMMQGRGEYLIICDSDLSMPIAEVENFLPPRVEGYDVVIGSREYPGAVRYNEPHYRHVMGRIFNFIVQIIAIRGFYDTQCGFKLFRREVAHHLFAIQTITGWTFDVEVLFLALKYGYTVTEIPIHWYFNSDSRVDPLRDTWSMFWDVVKIRLKYLKGDYDESTNSLSVTCPAVKGQQIAIDN